MKSPAVFEIDPELKPIIKGFLANRKKDAALLKKYLKSKNFEGIESIGHQLKGSCEAYGFANLSQLGARIEALAQETSPSRERILTAIFELDTFNASVKIQFKRAA